MRKGYWLIRMKKLYFLEVFVRREERLLETQPAFRLQYSIYHPDYEPVKRYVDVINQRDGVIDLGQLKIISKQILLNISIERETKSLREKNLVKIKLMRNLKKV